jgi:hypothetical protein
LQNRITPVFWNVETEKEKREYNAPKIGRLVMGGKWKEWIGPAIGIALVLGAITGILWRSIAAHFGWACCPGDTWVDLFKAMLIAGVVTVAVDPFLKRRFRLVGVGLSNFHDPSDASAQPALFS